MTQSAADIYEGKAETISVSNLDQLLQAITGLSSNQALCFGVSGVPKANLLTQDALRSNSYSGAIARNRENFFFRSGQSAILMLDCDLQEGQERTCNEIDEIIATIVPAWEKTSRLWRPSSSSCLFSGDTQLIGLRGWRCYVVVDDASAIPQVGAFIYQRLWEEGHGYIKISKSGKPLDRSLIDASVWQPERIDFAAEPVLGNGLIRRAPAPVLLPGTAFLGTARIRSTVSMSTWRATSKKLAQAKAAVKDKCDERRQAYVSERLKVLSAHGHSDQRMPAVLQRAAQEHVLSSKFVLSLADGSSITVGEILADREKWHEARFADPLEPDYHDDKRVAYANLRPKTGRPYIWSHAHGGQKYQLVPESADMELREPQLRSSRVIDRNGKGMDVDVYYKNVVSKGLLDLERLNELCGTPLETDVSSEQLAGYIEAGQITIANLIQCMRLDGSARSRDVYEEKLIEIARLKMSSQISSRDIDDRIAAARLNFRVKQKTIEADFKRVEQDLIDATSATKTGVLSGGETKLIKPLRDYAERFALINISGKAFVLDINKHDFPKALMAPSDFELLQRKDRIELGRQVIYPAKEFITKPPANARVYHDGAVFRPSGTVSADQFNLYRGMSVKPDESGSCSLFYELLRDVWANGAADVAEWLIEWFKHIAAHPSEKVGTSVAIRGAPGDGKSIVCEKLMSGILGNMLLRVTDQRLVLGEFNETLAGKLLTVLEEAAFAGDKAAFDSMKELITGEKVTINPKHKAPVTIDNYSRLVVVSNHEHFIHIKPGDRRYVVLELSPTWRGTNKFEQLVEQWNNGGAARFVYELSEHLLSKVKRQSAPAD